MEKVDVNLDWKRDRKRLTLIDREWKIEKDRHEVRLTKR